MKITMFVICADSIMNIILSSSIFLVCALSNTTLGILLAKNTFCFNKPIVKIG